MIKAICIVVVVVWGRLDVGRFEFESVMSARMSSAAYQHPLWSGYFEISSTIQDNSSINNVASVLSNIRYAAIPLAYALFLAFSSAIFLLNARISTKVIIFSACIFPLITLLVAGDFYRWVSMSANMSLLALMVLSARRAAAVPRQAFILLLLFSIFAPIGGAEIQRPFPIHQFIIEKLP